MDKKKVWTQEALDKLERRKEKVLDQMRANGWPIDEWHADLERRGVIKSSPPQGIKRLTQPPERLGSTNGFLPFGFSEFRQHPSHGKPVRRCLARSKWRDDGQCGRFALKDCVYCKRHAGVMAPRIQKEPSQFLVHGRETREIRRRRKAANAEMREVLKPAKALGIIAPDVRGPQPNKHGRIDMVAYRKRREARARWAEQKRKAQATLVPELVRKLIEAGILGSPDNLARA